MDTGTFKEIKKKNRTHNPSSPTHPCCAAITVKPRTADFNFFALSLHAVYTHPGNIVLCKSQNIPFGATAGNSLCVNSKFIKPSLSMTYY